MQDVRRKKVLAVASAGGHWIQLRRLTPAFEHHDCAYVTTSAGYRTEVAPHRYHTVRNAALSNKLGLVVLMAQVLRIVWKEKPDVVISTGAAPGFFAVLFGKAIGAKTIWVESIANADALSVSGRWVHYIADLWLTQWPHLAKPTGPFYKGSIL